MNTFCKSLNGGLYRKNCFITFGRRNFIPKALFIVLITICVRLCGQDYLIPKPLEPTDPKGQKLPADVPITVDTNGNVIKIHISFTTPMYRRAVFLPIACKFPEEYLISYNLSCYCCPLAQLKDALLWLERAIDGAGKKEIRLIALDDPNLKMLWNQLSEI